MNYRGITVTSSAYKAYCSILNRRLTLWAESNGKLTDFQNGFREKKKYNRSPNSCYVDNRKQKINEKINFLSLCRFQ